MRGLQADRATRSYRSRCRRPCWAMPSREPRVSRADSASRARAKHFVQYRDLRAPLGYDVARLDPVVEPVSFVLYGVDQTWTYTIENEISLEKLLLHLDLQREDRARTVDVARDTFFLTVRRGLGPVVLSVPAPHAAQASGDARFRRVVRAPGRERVQARAGVLVAAAVRGAAPPARHPDRHARPDAVRAGRGQRGGRGGLPPSHPPRGVPPGAATPSSVPVRATAAR